MAATLESKCLALGLGVQVGGGRFPRVFGDKFGEEFCDKFGDEFSESPNLVMN